MTHLRRQFLASLGGLVSAMHVSATSRAQESSGSLRPRIKVGQIGVGHGHASKLKVYRDSPDYEVIGIVEDSVQLRMQAESSSTFQGLPWLTRDEMLSTPGLQAVLIETSVRELLPNARAALEAGKHVHIDKPAGESLSELADLMHIARERRRVVQLGYMYRYNPGVVLLREFLAQGWLGEVFEVDAVMSKVLSRDNRKELAIYPGGTMFELGCHLIDLVVGILGEPQRITPFIRHSSSLDDGLNDNMLAVFEYPRATATIRSSALEVEGFERRHLTVCGTAGTFHIQPLDNPTVKLSLSRPSGRYAAGTQIVQLPKYSRYVDDAADMARIVRGEKQPDFSMEHDLAVQKSVLLSSGLSNAAR